jgi:hypothetical protein
VELEDVRQILPWVLHEKLVPNTRSAFFDAAGNRTLLRDRVAWIRHLFDAGIRQYGRHKPLRDEVMGIRDELDRGLAGVDAATTRSRMRVIAGLIAKTMKHSELSGPVYEDLIHLKSMYSRYSNYAQWQQHRG